MACRVLDEGRYLVDVAGTNSQAFGVCAAARVCCGGIRCVGRSLSAANGAAKCWDRSQLGILCKREPSKTKPKR